MKDPDSRFIELISNYYTDTLNESDSSKLISWIKENPDNKATFTNYISLLNDYQKIKFLEQVDEEIVFDDLSIRINKKRKLRFIRNLSVAASILILVSVGIAIRLNTVGSNENSVQPNFDQLAQTGSKRAVLTFADGSSVKLEEEEEQMFYEKDGTLIEKDDNNTLSYQANSKFPATTLYNTIDVPRGGEYSLVLSDGTKVWLNAESSLRFPVTFNSAERTVYVTGEAFFDVVEDSKRPFIVNASKAKVKVLGTRFNINSYPELEFISATLVEGKLEVFNWTQSEIIYPGNQALLSKADENIQINEVNTNLYTSWVDGILEFENRDLEFIMIQLSRWYQVDFNFKDEDLKNLRFSGAIKRNNTFDYALDLIEKISNVEFVVENSKIVIEKKN